MLQFPSQSPVLVASRWEERCPAEERGAGGVGCSWPCRCKVLGPGVALLRCWLAQLATALPCWCSLPRATWWATSPLVLGSSFPISAAPQWRKAVTSLPAPLPVCVNFSCDVLEALVKITRTPVRRKGTAYTLVTVIILLLIIIHFLQKVSGFLLPFTALGLHGPVALHPFTT